MAHIIFRESEFFRFWLYSPMDQLNPRDQFFIHAWSSLQSSHQASHSCLHSGTSTNLSLRIFIPSTWNGKVSTGLSCVNHFIFACSLFRDWKLICGNLNLRCMLLSYVNSTHAHILQECWIREGSNSQILPKIKFSRIIVNLQWSRQTV